MEANGKNGESSSTEERLDERHGGSGNENGDERRESDQQEIQPIATRGPENTEEQVGNGAGDHHERHLAGNGRRNFPPFWWGGCHAPTHTVLSQFSRTPSWLDEERAARMCALIDKALEHNNALNVS